MSKKELPPTEIETFTIGPSCCGHFQTARDLCNHCIANRMYSHALCFVPPTLSKGMEYEQQLQGIGEIIGSSKT